MNILCPARSLRRRAAAIGGLQHGKVERQSAERAGEKTRENSAVKRPVECKYSPIMATATAKGARAQPGASKRPERPDAKKNVTVQTASTSDT